MLPSQKQIRETIIKELDLGLLSAEKQTEIITGLAEEIMKRVMIMAMERLPAERHADFKSLIGGDELTIVKFLDENIPEFQKLIDHEVKSAIKEFQELSGARKK
ncbi:MAG: hypothetical protein HZA95_03460 [Candidatus Vogelbacteria bacterium]|nr:hypothetical protein [Candidatus Vogelbacteria bacterium]